MVTTIRKKLSIIFAVVSAVSLLTLSAYATADENQPTQVEEQSTLSPEEQVKLDERSAIVREYFLSMEKAKGILDKKNLELNELNKEGAVYSRSVIQELNSLTEKYNEIKDSYADYGLIKIEAEPQMVTMASSAADYDFNNELQLFYDSSIGKYLLHSAGHFTNTNWKNDMSAFTNGFTGWKTMGQYDGYSLYSLHKDINVYNPEFYTLRYSDPSIDINWTTSASLYPDPRGYGWAYQDKAHLTWFSFLSEIDDYDNWRQLGWYYFDFVGPKPVGQTISFKASFGHTWNSTNINSISYPAGFGWSTSSNKWEDAISKSFTIN